MFSNEMRDWAGRRGYQRGPALASLAWNGHAAAGEGVAGAVRLAAGLVHLLAAGGWIAAVLMFLGMLLRG